MSQVTTLLILQSHFTSPLRWAPVLSAPPWYSALLALPQFLVLALPHGPGPPSLPRFLLRSPQNLDCSVFGASGNRSWGGGGYLWVIFPITHCTDHPTVIITTLPLITQLSPITRSPESHYTHLTKDIISSSSLSSIV